MLQYIAKRILIFIPTLFAISLLTFIISINAPGDPVDLMLNANVGGQGQSSQKIATEKTYLVVKHKLGLDLPVFYFTLTNLAGSDTLYKIPNPANRETLKHLSNEFGSWTNVSAYYPAEKNIRI